MKKENKEKIPHVLKMVPKHNNKYYGNIYSINNNDKIVCFLPPKTITQSIKLAKQWAKNNNCYINSVYIYFLN